MSFPGSGLISDITAGAQAQFSNLQGGLASLANKVSLNGLKDIANKGVEGLSKAAGGLFAKSPAAQIQTVFPTNGLPKIGPEKADPGPPPTLKSTVPASALTYPTDLKYFTMFKFATYQRILATDKPKEQYTATIVLPMPSNLNEVFTVGYDTAELGLAGAGADQLIRRAREFQGASGGSVRGGADDVTMAGIAVGAITAAGAAALGQKSVAKDVARIASGLTPNPYQAVIFNNVELRTHSFQYRFAPNSRAELETVKKIIKQLKKAMLPSFIKGSADTAFSFPDTCEISFGPNKEVPYKFKKCVMTGMAVNYSPNGPAFFKTGDPVIVDVSMSFKEIEPYTRRDEGEEDKEDKAFSAENVKKVVEAKKKADQQANVNQRAGAVADANLPPGNSTFNGAP